MKAIEAPMEWLEFCEDLLRESKRKAAKKIYNKYGNEVAFPMFLHVDLCNAMNSVFISAPNREEAFRFIQQALNEVSGLKQE